MTAPLVAAVLVTRDRREVLRETLTAVHGQSRAPDRVIVVDNASGDGTREMLADAFPGTLVVALEENAGSAGGFHAGIAAGMREHADWLWLLDDDSWPRPTALEALLGAAEDAPGEGPPDLLASRVEWRDGEPHPMNEPTVQRRDPELLVAAVRRGLLPLRASTFVSMLLARRAVERVGMPRRDFFWQADDIEYTARILRRARGFFVPASVVEHRTPTKHTSIGDERRFYHHARNTVLMLRGQAWSPSEKPALLWALVRSVGRYLRANRASPASVGTLARAFRDGLSSPSG